jgi:uncharacterized protein (DUF1697 family)
MPRQTRYVALLRGVNLGPHNRISMDVLRSLIIDAGWADPQTYIQSGNVIFTAALSAAAVEARLEKMINVEFGLTIPVIVRSAADWSGCVAANPFPRQTKARPQYVLLAVSKSAPKSDAEAALQERAARNEKVRRIGDTLYIYFGGGVGRSKLTPAVLDRLVGSPVTARNWLTVLKLKELSAQTNDKINR